MTVVSAASSVLAGGTSELRHGDDDCVFAEVTKVGPKGGERLREVTENIGKLSLGAAFVDMMVPAADVGEGYLHSQIRFDQLRQLAKAVAESPTRIVCAGRRFVLCGVGRLQ